MGASRFLHRQMLAHPNLRSSRVQAALPVFKAASNLGFQQGGQGGFQVGFQGGFQSGNFAGRATEPAALQLSGLLNVPVEVKPL
jgi:hypothetical protein